MAVVVQWKSGGTIHTKTCHRRALHFGSVPPLGVEAIRLPGRGVAHHHGKIFWGQDGYRYVNLTELPTYLFRAGRGGKLEFELNPFYPQCTIATGDKLVVGATTIKIQSLGIPRFSMHLEKSLKLPGGLEVKVFVRGGPHFDQAASFDAEELAPLVACLRQYVSRHELVRQAADWLYRRLTEMQGSLPAPGADGVEYAGVRDVRWWELATLEPEFDAEPTGGNARSEPCPIVPWGRLISPDEEVLAKGLPMHIQAYNRETVALAIAVHMVGWEDRHRAPAAARNTSEGRPSYLFTIELSKGQPRPDFWGLLYHFGLLVSDALSDLAVRRKLLTVEYERDLAREAPEIFHDIKTQLWVVKDFLGRSPGQVRDAARWHGFAGGWQEARQRAEYAFDLSIWGDRCLRQGSGCRLGLTPVMDCLANCPVLKHYWGRRAEDTTCELDVSCPEFSFSFDKTALSLILVKLIRNAEAAKRSPGPGNRSDVAVWVRLVQRRLRPGKILDYVVFRVLDNGDGLAPSAVATIFQARFRHATGSGMGSAVVSRLVHLHEGLIEVASQERLGTAVSVYLPFVCKEKVSRGAPELKSYREYARDRFGAGRWASFDAAMREYPDEYREVWGWMRRHAASVSAKA